MFQDLINEQQMHITHDYIARHKIKDKIERTYCPEDYEVEKLESVAANFPIKSLIWILRPKP